VKVSGTPGNGPHGESVPTTMCSPMPQRALVGRTISQLGAMQKRGPHSSASSSIELISIGCLITSPDFRCLTLYLSITLSDLPSL